MIFVVAGPACRGDGEAITRAVERAYPDQVCELVAEGATWTRPAEWDDVLVVVYAREPWPHWAREFVTVYSAAHPVAVDRAGGFIVPVSVDATAMIPPPPLALNKAALYDRTEASLDRITRAAGAFLGLALRPEEHKIFIAYRSTDGGAIARDLFARLGAAGFAPWLDEAPDNLPIGVDVQRRIHEQLRAAAMLLVVDTPDAPASAWIAEEIVAALGELIPVCPVVTGPDRDIARFIPLAPLQRRAAVKPGGPDGAPLSDDEWQRIRLEIEVLLLSAYRRRLRITTRAQQTFSRNGFAWRALDDRRRVFEAQQATTGRVPGKVVVSHCSIHEATYVPALRVYGEFLAAYRDIASVNEKLCIYDRDRVLSAAETAAIRQELAGVPSFTLAHYNELGLLIRSNFTQLG